MEFTAWLAWSVAGTIAGIATGLIPGLHVNTIAAVAISFGVTGPGPAVAATALAATHTCITILPAAYLGIPDTDAPTAMLPAHAMALSGDGPRAIQISLHASLAAAAVAVALTWPYQLLLQSPLQAWLDVATPWLLAAVLLWLVWRAQHRGWAVALVLASGVLGLVAPRVPLHAVVGTPSALLPMLSGLFGASLWFAAATRAAPLPDQQPPRAQDVAIARIARGAALASVTAVLPGITSATATAMAARRDAPKHALATLSAVDTAHATFAIVVLWVLGTTRTGLAITVDAWLGASPWRAGGPPPELTLLLATILLAALGAALAGRLIERPWRKAVQSIDVRRLNGSAIAIVIAIVAALSGIGGLAIYAVAACLGAVPLLVGVSRISLTGCLIVPVLYWHLA